MSHVSLPNNLDEHLPPMAAKALPRETHDGRCWPSLFFRPTPSKNLSITGAAVSWRCVARIAPHVIASSAASARWSHRCSWECKKYQKVLQEAATAPPKNTGQNLKRVLSFDQRQHKNMKDCFPSPRIHSPRSSPILGPPTNTLETLLKLFHRGSFPFVQPHP